MIANGLRPSLPFVVLLVFLPLARQRQLDDPLSGCDPPTSALERRDRRLPVGLHRGGTRGARSTRSGCGTERLEGRPGGRVTATLTRRPTATFAWAVAIVAVVSALTWVPGRLAAHHEPGRGVRHHLPVADPLDRHDRADLAVPGHLRRSRRLHGRAAGQQFGLPIVLGMVAGGLLAAGLGVVVALPTLRLAGLPLALATLAFALLADNILFPNSWIGQRGRRRHRAPPVGRAGQLRRRQAVLRAVAGHPGRRAPAW